MRLSSLDLSRYQCDYIDLRKETLFSTSIKTRDFQTETAVEETIETFFLRIYHKGSWLYTSFFEIGELESRIKSLTDHIRHFPEKESLSFFKQKPYKESRMLFENLNPEKYSTGEKKKLLEDYCEILKKSPKCVSNTGMYRDWYVKREFVSSSGVWYEYDKTWAGIYVYYILKNKDSRYQTSFKRCEKDYKTLETYFEDFEKDNEEARIFSEAEPVKSGKFPLILSPNVAGVFAHESFGHKSESDFMLNDPKLLEEWKIGNPVANPKVSIIDDGNLETTGYCPFDDEGTKAKKTYLIKDGKLSGRLHNRETAFLFNEEYTGNSRAISCEYEPLIRMTTTYFEKGNETLDELFSRIDNGYFISNYKHGSGNSTFTIAPDRSYEIKNGKITKPVLISVITGNVFNTLNLITGVSDRVEFQENIFGGCGKMGQFPLPVSHGGPHLLIEELQIS